MAPEVTPTDEKVDQFIVFAGYGELMLGFQLLELDLWGFFIRRFKTRSTLDQRIRKIEAWDANSLGQLVGNVRSELSRELADELTGAVEARNYLAHTWLREYAVVVPSKRARDAAVQQLVDWSVRLEALRGAVAGHLRSLGYDPAAIEIDAETQAVIDGLRPTMWPLTAPDDPESGDPVG